MERHISQLFGLNNKIAKHVERDYKDTATRGFNSRPVHLTVYFLIGYLQNYL